MPKKKQDFNKSFVADVLEQIDRFNNGMKRQQQAHEPSELAVNQYREMRDEMLTFLLEYLVEIGGKNVVKDFARQLDAPVAAWLTPQYFDAIEG